jgi:hypothetical protein
MKFNGIFNGVDFDLDAYVIGLNDHLNFHLREGAKHWLQAVTGRVPLWSGMARASLFKIAQLVNSTVVLSPLKAKSRVPQGKELGTGQIVSQFPNYRFEVSVAVPHYVIQEFRSTRPRGSPSAPWRSFDAGLVAFIDYASTVSLPVVVFKTHQIARI